MNNPQLSKNNFIITSMFLVIAFIAFMVYIDYLDVFFTATDTLTMIATGRIQSLQDALNIFTDPMMSGTSFTEIAKFYRPVTTLTFSFDYFAWGLNPFGYHLTNLALHTIASIFVFFFMLTLSKGKKFTSFMSAVIFSTHPILVEVVPGIARRADMLATLFMLLSLLLCVKYFTGLSRHKTYLSFSIISYALALGSKEIAIILPFMVFSYLFITSYGNNLPLKKITVKTVKDTIPYIAVTIIYLAWRIYVLQGIGGYTAEFSINNPPTSLLMIVKIYFTGLLYPVDFANNILTNMAGLLITFLSLIMILWYLNDKNSESTNNKTIRIAKKILITTVLFLPAINIFAYHLISTSFSLILFFFAAGIAINHQINKIKKFDNNSYCYKQVLFLSFCFLLPLALYLLLQSFDHRYLYTPAVFFSCIIGIAIAESFQSVVKKTPTIISPRSGSRRFSLQLISNILIAFSMIALSVSFIVNSSLIKTYNDWGANAMASSKLLNRISEIVRSSPDDTAIHVYNLPYRISYAGANEIDTRTASFINYHSIKSWINLSFPKNHINIIAYPETRVLKDPHDIEIQTIKIDEKNIKLILVPQYNNIRN